MNKRARQGLGAALLGAAVWGLVALYGLTTDTSDLGAAATAAFTLVALAGITAVIGGVVVAGFSLIRGR